MPAKPKPTAKKPTAKKRASRTTKRAVAPKSNKSAAKPARKAAAKPARKPAAKLAKPAKPAVKPAKPAAPKPKLLSGGNPQIAKGDGDASVQAWLAAAPEWKGELARRLDAIITKTVPHVRKAVKWNSPFYGVDGLGWFLTMHCMTEYVKVAFFRGAELTPPPPVASKQKYVRYLDIRANDFGSQPTEAQFIDWVQQASARKGWEMK
jgi:hypothetical protein